MVSEIFMQNLTTNMSMSMNRTNADFLLDDNSPDWGGIAADDMTYPFLSSGGGIGVIKTSMNNSRQVTIIGWIYNNESGTIEQKKDFLNKFCNPFDELKIVCNEYTLLGHFSQPIVYPNNDSDNNNCVCKFLLYITCPFPLFRKEISSADDINTGLTNSFYFPLVLPSESTYVFGSKVRDGNVPILNNGTIATGFVIYIKPISNITGLKLTLGNQIFKFKTNYTIAANKEVKISSVTGSMGIWLKSAGGSYESIFSAFDLSSDWLKAPVGLSNISLSCESGSVSAIDTIIELNELYYAMEEQ